MGEYLFIASAILSVVNGVVLLCVNPHRVVNKVFFAASVWIAIWFTCIAMAIHEGIRYAENSNEVIIFWLRSSTSTGALLGGFAWMMRNALIGDKKNIWQVFRDSWFWFFISLSMAVLSCSEFYIPSDSTPINKHYGIGYGIFVTVAAVSCIWFLVDAFRQTRNLEGVRKIEMQFFVLNLVCACLLVICSNLAGVYLNLEWLKRLGPIWFLALHGLTVWAVCYHRVFDAKQIIVSISQRLLLLSFLGATALVVDQVLDSFIHNPWSPFLTAIIICSAGIACDGPTRRWLGLDQNHLLLAPRRTIIDWARKIPDEEELKEKFEYLLREQCQTGSAMLLSSQGNSFPGFHLVLNGDWAGFATLCKEGWTTPETLQRSRSADGTSECAEFMLRHQLGALLAVPKGSFPPSLVVGLGQKASLRPYTFPDIQGLLELAELMDNILTHARVSTHAARIEKMASATMMSRGLAHDLNNLATPVATFLHHMEGRVAADTSAGDVLIDAKHSLKIMQDYIQESLFFARQLVPHLSRVDARELLTSVLRLSHERATAAGLRVTIRCDENLTFVADEALLKRLLQNLVFNGFDASKPGDMIEVSAFATAGDLVNLGVSDQGQGIAPEVREHIFEPYFTTKNSGNEHRGFGLGLAICQKIVELHCGKIVVSPNVTRGSLFTVIIPRGDLLNTMPPLATNRSAMRTPASLELSTSLAPIETPSAY